MKGEKQKMIKKIISLLLVLVALFSLASCEGEYQFGIGTGGNGSGGGDDDGSDDGGDEGSDSGGYVPPTLNGDPTDDFVVTLKADGKSYTPRTNMYVYWNDGSSIHTAKVDSDGVARIDGLDGDYRVTLSGVPNEYTYNPNGNVATNDNRSIVVDLYTLNHLAGGGTDIYNCYSFNKAGVYCATIDNPDDAIFFRYAPEGMGTYSIESWVDITADNVNPYIEVWRGTFAYGWYEKTIDDGGPMGSYTINFIHEVGIAAENISGGGQATYAFAIKADTKNNKYPVTITFAVKRNGDFELPDYSGSLGNPQKGMIAPTYDFTNFNIEDHNYGSDYVLKNPEYQYKGSTYAFDDRRFQLWEKSDNGDGFYHVYDEEKYAETDGYGPILYAYITESCRFLDRAFTEIEYDYNGNIVYNNLGAYKHMIEGVSLTARPGHYYCTSDCPCHTCHCYEEENPSCECTCEEGNLSPDCECNDEIWACPEGCKKCTANCTPISPELVGFEGYQAYCNDDGLVPVTQDIQDFLLAYCKKQQFFYDGKGTMENVLIDDKYFQAVGDSGWLFACAYYEKISP